MRQFAGIAALWGCLAMAQAAVGVSVIEGEFADDVVFLSADAGVDPPLFSFASPSPFRGGYSAYQGLPATDGCYAAAAVTGTKGEALTFTRATTRFCPTSANEATGVMCASGEVCITSSGTTRGISVFRAGTNTVLRSQEIDDAAWTKEAAGGVAAMTVTANHATVAPDGTATAERLQITATSGAEFCDLYQAVAVASGAAFTCSAWVRGTTGSGTTDLCSYDGASWNCSVVAFTTAWQRFSHVRSSGTATARYCKLGNNSAQNGGTARTASDVLVWGLQGEASPYPTPYVATTSASATRNAETATFPISWSGSTWSAASTLVQRKATAGFGIVALHSSFPAGGPNALSYVTGGGLMSMYSAGAEHATFDPSSYYSTSDRAAAYCTGSASGNIWAGHETTGVSCGSFSTGNTTLAVGWFTANTQNNAINSDVCVDPDPARCR